MIEKYYSYKYKFSIIMAVYNVEKYLDETMQSLIEQSLDFRTYVQVIFINDGSKDNSEEICLKYKNLYPDNIIYIKKENGGVSSARNKGLEVAEGQYINFLDPDDKLSANTLLTVGKFFDNHYYEIDLVAIPLQFFDAKTGGHPLNRKFKGNRIIDIEKEFKSIVLSSSSSFIKSHIVKNYRFDENLRYGEDAHLINRIILRTGKYGTIENCKYLYRKRKDGTSAIDNSGESKDWYTEFLNKGPMDLMEESQKVYGEVIKYIQYLVMYDLKWRVHIETLKNSNMNDKEKDEFIETIEEILKQIDDDVILETDTKLRYKLFMLEMKYGNDLKYILSFLKDNCKILFKNRVLCDLKDSTLAVQVLDIKDDLLTIEGYTEVALAGELYEVVATINNKEFKSQHINRPDKNVNALDKIILDRKGFRIKIDLKKTGIGDIKLQIKINNNYIRPRIWIDRNVRLYSFIDESYFTQDKYCIVYIYNCFVILHNNIKTRIGREFRFAQQLYKSNNKKMILYRLILKLIKSINRKKIWLFMDRVDRADDNAEHLFKYSNKQNDKIKKYFILSKDSTDWNRLSQIGHVIDYGSIKHKMLFILCDKMISAHTGDFARHQFDGNGILLRNLVDFDFIFLQHGIIKDDLSFNLNRYNTQFKMFVTSAEKEYESIINGNYYYNEDVIKLTGLPRYDNLINNDKKQIFIIPTWNKEVVGPIDPETRLRIYNPKFKESDYFKIYNSLINDRKLIEYAKKYNYEILFYPHPEIYQQVEDFSKNDYVKFINHEVSYQKLLTESSLLITDYSSIAFDFAYMKKPVIYFQWYENHYEQGYFDYETMGMGEVCREYNELIETMINYMKNGCKMKDEYIDRVNAFYRYTDTNNCKRVYEEINRI
ncbi:hypothetical protein DIC82_02510 [Clostridium beijerinckii]|nr:hypothetical protein DIC82_02510 [Clostridium beijerinckii]